MLAEDEYTIHQLDVLVHLAREHDDSDTSSASCVSSL